MSTNTREEQTGIEADRDHEIDTLRLDLRDALGDASTAISKARWAVDRLSSNAVYDVEVAEGGGDRIKAALLQADLGIAAAQHLARNARPACGAIPPDVKGSIPCHLPDGHLAEGIQHFSTSGCAGSEIRWS